MTTLSTYPVRLINIKHMVGPVGRQTCTVVWKWLLEGRDACNDGLTEATLRLANFADHTPDWEAPHHSTYVAPW